MAGDDRRDLVGGLLAATGAFAYSITIVIGRTLAKAGVPSSLGLGVRFSIAGTLLLLAVVATRRPLLPVPGERRHALVLGGIGYAVESTFFYLGLANGSAAAVALLFYSYPALVAVIEAVIERRWPDRRTAVALVLSASGAGAVAAGGGRLDISGLGIVCALLSALTFACYLVAGGRLMKRTDALTTGAWVAVGAGGALLTRTLVGGDVSVPPGHWAQLALYGASTAVAFVCMFAALRVLGASRTAVVMTLEAVFAVFLAALVLDEPVHLLEAIGGIGILTGAILVSLRRAAAAEAAESSP
ncbi:MAG TPA: DMT family transporter [Acidimicrobiales bacterium]|nr:DMT family transporter [Acidimicrobiales bacterium]